MLFTLGKVFFTAWEKRLLLMKAQTPPALQGKDGRVSTWGAQSQCSPQVPSQSTHADPSLQGLEHTSDPCFQSIPQVPCTKGPERRDTGN